VELELSKVKPVAAISEAAPKRCVAMLREHAFDESDRFVKIYIPYKCLGTREEDVQLETTESSFKLTITDNDKDYEFNVVSLLKPIDVAKSYKKVKSDDQMVVVYLKKAKEGKLELKLSILSYSIDLNYFVGEKWSCLTVTEKRLKEEKTKAFDEDKGSSGDDPMGGLMKIMKTMYDSGDTKMKQQIAKAWTEGQDKNRQNPMM
jgi:calcyclin binding protein